MGVETLDNISKVDGMQMRASVNPLAPVVTVNYFNVKIDPRLGYNYPANNYVGVIFGGKLYKDCPFITINKGNNNSYLLSTNGSGLRTLIAAGDTATASILATIKGKILRNQRISPTVVEKNIHVVWYLAKDMFNGWHIDGLLTDKADIKEACDACRDEGFQEITFGENETMPISTAKIMQKEIPNSRLVTTPDGGHHHMVDNPDVYYKHLADFIREVEDGSFKGE